MSDRMSGIIAEINQDRNEHVPTMMAESGQSSEVVVGCSSAARSTDALWAGSQAAGIMTAYLPPVTKGVTGPAARAGSEAGMLGTQLVKTQAPTAAKMAADAIPGAIDAAQGFLGADADGPTMGLSGFATAEQVTATMPKGEYERCLDRYGYE
jgi:hypothetical protein